MENSTSTLQGLFKSPITKKIFNGTKETFPANVSPRGTGFHSGIKLVPKKRNTVIKPFSFERKSTYVERKETSDSLEIKAANSGVATAVGFSSPGETSKVTFSNVSPQGNGLHSGTKMIPKKNSTVVKAFSFEKKSSQLESKETSDSLEAEAATSGVATAVEFSSPSKISKVTVLNAAPKGTDFHSGIKLGLKKRSTVDKPFSFERNSNLLENKEAFDSLETIAEASGVATAVGFSNISETSKLTVFNVASKRTGFHSGIKLVPKKKSTVVKAFSFDRKSNYLQIKESPDSSGTKAVTSGVATTMGFSKTSKIPALKVTSKGTNFHSGIKFAPGKKKNTTVKPFNFERTSNRLENKETSDFPETKIATSSVVLWDYLGKS